MRSLIATILPGLCLFLGICSHSFAEPLVVTVQGPETAADTRYDYDHAVIRLALEKTRNDFGDFVLKETPIGQNSQRSLTAAASGTYKNYVIKTSARNDLINKVGIVPFPVDLGIVGYREAFTSTSTKTRLASVQTLEQMKEFNMVQGIGWLDTTILQSHGFDVRTIDNYNSMFKMVALNRMDLFPRGANELEAEWETHNTIPQLAYDEAVALYYPLPRFLVTSKTNKDLIDRLYEGLTRAYDDGSLISLWEDKYQSSIDFVNLGARKVFRLSNPFISDFDPGWERYVYDPLAAVTDTQNSGQKASSAN